MAPATDELVRPDDVIDPPDDDAAKLAAEEEAARQERFDALNPCEICQAHQHEGPEGEAWYNGHETALHCWRCGYRPGQAVSPTVTLQRPGMSQAELRQAFVDLKSSVVSELLGEFRRAGVLPADEQTAKAQIEGAVDRVVEPPPATDQGAGG